MPIGDRLVGDGGFAVVMRQAASGAGAAAMQELLDATRAHLTGEPHLPRVLPHPYAFNLFSHDTPIDPDSGYNSEETKVVNESRKILEARPGACGNAPSRRIAIVFVTEKYYILNIWNSKPYCAVFKAHLKITLKLKRQ